MSLFLIAVTAAVAASLGFLASRRRGPSDETGETRASKLGGGAKPKRLPAPADPLEGLGLALGDVVSAEGDERWLAGAIVARDTALAAVLFVSPEGLSHRVVGLVPAHARSIAWLEPVTVESPAEPPGVLEIGGMAMQRKSRLPVTFERMGQGTPLVGAAGMLAVYEAGGREVALVVTSEGKTLAWSGRRLEEGEYDRMGRVSADE